MAGIFDIKDMGQVRTNFGESSCAHSTRVCDSVSAEYLALEAKVSSLIASTSLSLLEKLAISLQFENGLRISELLSLRYEHINSRGQIFVKGLKNSNDRLIQLPHINRFSFAASGGCGYIFEGFSRFYFYRLYKKLGLYVELENSKYNSVTHCFRHLYLESVVKDYNSLELAQQAIGHKSINSTMHYTNINRVKNKK